MYDAYPKNTMHKLVKSGNRVAIISVVLLAPVSFCCCQFYTPFEIRNCCASSNSNCTTGELDHLKI